MNGAFEFKQRITMLKATGKKARSLREFRDALALIMTYVVNIYLLSALRVSK